MAFLVASLFAFVWHGIATQSHVHAEEGSAWLAGYHAVISDTSRSAPSDPASDDADGCRLCQEFAFSAFYLPPGALTFTILSPTAYWSVAGSDTIGAFPHASHYWQSRAPPSRS